MWRGWGVGGGVEKEKGMKRSARFKVENVFLVLQSSVLYLESCFCLHWNNFVDYIYLKHKLLQSLEGILFGSYLKTLPVLIQSGQGVFNF